MEVQRGQNFDTILFVVVVVVVLVVAVVAVVVVVVVVVVVAVVNETSTKDNLCFSSKKY